MYQALYRKWRPLCFADVIGQQHITDTLRGQLLSNRLSHAYLFTGTRGTGKTTCAKILAQAVNCLNPVNGDPCNECSACRSILDNATLDVVEIDAASNNGVDNVREIRDEIRYAPSVVQKKVFIIDEVHMLSSGAFNALLKTLEEPPSHVMFILATTEIHKVPATILSRCQRFDFRRIMPEVIAKRLIEIAQIEELPLTQDGAMLIARLADGAMRDALSMLDRTAGYPKIDQESVAKGLGILGTNDALSLMHAIKTANLTSAIETIGKAYESGRELTGVIEQLLSLIRDLLIVKTQNTSNMISPAYSIENLHTLGSGIASSTLIAYSRILQDAVSRIKYASNRRVEAELCMIRLCTMGGESYDSLQGRVEALEEKVKNGVVPNTLAIESPPCEQQSVSELEPCESEEPAQEWEEWSTVLDRVTGKIPMGTLSCLQIASHAQVEAGRVFVFCEDDVTAGLAAAQPTINILSEIASAVVGRTVRVKVFGPDQKPHQHYASASDEILKKAKQFDIQVTEF